MTHFEALTGGAFDRLNWRHSGEFDQNFSNKSNARGLPGGGMGGFGIDRYITETLLYTYTKTLKLFISAKFIEEMMFETVMLGKCFCHFN